MLRYFGLCPYACNNWKHTEQIFVKFDTGDFYQGLSRHSSFRLDQTVWMPTWHETRIDLTWLISCFDVEYIYGFVWWGVCKQSRWRHSVTEPSEDSGYVLLWQRYDNNKMVAMRYYENVMTTTMSQYSDDVSSVTHAGCICAPVNAITTCIYIRVSFCCWRCVYWACYRCILHLQQYSHRLNLIFFLKIIRKAWIRCFYSANIFKC